MGVGQGAGSAGTPFLSPPSREPGITLGNSLCLEKCRGAPTPGREALGVFQPVEGRAVAGVQAAGPPAHASGSQLLDRPWGFPHVCCGRSSCSPESPMLPPERLRP